MRSIRLCFCVETSLGSRSKTCRASVEKIEANGSDCRYSSYQRGFIGLEYSDFAELG